MLPQPPLAKAISGRTYQLAPNPLGLRALQLRFLSPTHAQARLDSSNREMIVPIGLDGGYRVAVDPASHEPVAGRGRWITPERFRVEIDTIARINHVTAELSFANDELRGWARERSGLVSEMQLSGRAMP
jgi:hypothetical protein